MMPPERAVDLAELRVVLTDAKEKGGWHREIITPGGCLMLLDLLDAANARVAELEAGQCNTGR